MTEFKLINRVITHEDDTWIHGIDYYNDNSETPWVTMTDEGHKKLFWHVYPPNETFSELGVSDEKWGWLQNFFEESWIEPKGETGLYYIWYASYETDANVIANWILGPISETLTECEIDSKNISWLYPLSLLRDFYKIYSTDKFIKSKAKEAIIELSFRTLDEIANDDKFFRGDEGIEKSLVDKVLTANKDKIAEQGFDKIVNWLVGQVMKESRGKADPAEVKRLLTVDK